MLLQSLLRPVLTPIMRGIFDPALCTNATGSAWSPLSLWPDGISSAGMWISPRTLTSEWQDYTGTTPVEEPGTVADSSNPVGLALDIRAGATVLTDPGNHMLQSTSAARPLMSAYDGQTLGPGDTYDATDFPIAQLYDGVDDGMATAAFPAGTLIDGMDCMIAVRRDSGAACVAGLYTGAGVFFGAASTDIWTCHSGVGTPTVYVDSTQVPGGTAVTAVDLNAALTVYNPTTSDGWHILEFRGLNLSAWTVAKFGEYGGGFSFPGARGDILLYPSTASTEDKDAARQYLADYYGVTLP
jgi:hypothetical protein